MKRQTVKQKINNSEAIEDDYKKNYRLLKRMKMEYNEFLHLWTIRLSVLTQISDEMVFLSTHSIFKDQIFRVLDEQKFKLIEEVRNLQKKIK